MRFRTQKEADEFIRGLLQAREAGKREFMTAKLDSIPAWSGTPKDPAKEWVPDGSEVEAVYLSYAPATDKQKEQAKPARLAGVKLERISGRLVDVRKCQDGTTQVLFTSGLRDGQGEVPFRGPNIDKGILCYLSVGEGLGEPVEDIIARVPQALLDKLKAGKEAKAKKTKVPATAREQVPAAAVVAPEPVMVRVKRANAIIDVPAARNDEPGESRLKLK